MKQLLAIALLLLTSVACQAAPYVACVGNVSVHSDSAHASITVIDLADNTARSVSEGLRSARNPCWSPDGSKLAFEAVGEGFRDVVVCNPDGSERLNVTDSPDIWEGAPCLVSANSVAYLAGPDRTDVWLADTRTGAKTQLTSRPMFRKQPVASRDGKWLAVVSSDKLAGPGEIQLITVTGGEARTLTPGLALYSVPAFSPDGGTIAFCFDGCDIGGATRGLATMPVAGGEPSLIAKDGYPFAALCYSPDGKRIAYTGAHSYHNTYIHIVTADGAETVTPKQSPAHIVGWPSFTPGGESLAYHGVYAAKYTVRLVDLATGENTQLTPDGQTGVTPACSPR